LLGDVNATFCGVAAVEEFALQKSYANTRMVFVVALSPRRALLQIFHHKHVQPPLAGLACFPSRATLVAAKLHLPAAEVDTIWHFAVNRA
jgi:hypothetical protein